MREDNSLINRTWQPSKVHYVSWSMGGGETRGGWHVKNISHDESCNKMPLTLQRMSGVWPLPLSSFIFTLLAESSASFLSKCSSIWNNLTGCQEWDESLCAAWLKGRGSKTPATRSGSWKHCGEPSLLSLVRTCWAEQKNGKEMQLPRGSKQEVSDLLPPCLGIDWWLPIKIFSL